MLVCIFLSTVMLCGQGGPYPASKPLWAPPGKGEGAIPTWTSNPRPMKLKHSISECQLPQL